jgi:hypothetical protein
MYALGHLLVMLRGSFAYDLRIFSWLNLEIGISDLKNPKWCIIGLWMLIFVIYGL